MSYLDMGALLGLGQAEQIVESITSAHVEALPWTGREERKKAREARKRQAITLEQQRLAAEMDRERREEIRHYSKAFQRKLEEVSLEHQSVLNAASQAERILKAFLEQTQAYYVDLLDAVEAAKSARVQSQVIVDDLASLRPLTDDPATLAALVSEAQAGLLQIKGHSISARKALAVAHDVQRRRSAGVDGLGANPFQAAIDTLFRPEKAQESRARAERPLRALQAEKARLQAQASAGWARLAGWVLLAGAVGAAGTALYRRRKRRRT